MTPHCVLTVGTNPLPVLVAAHRLLRAFPEALLTLLHSPESEDQARSVLEVLSEKLGRRENHWESKAVADARDPEKIADSVKNLRLSGPLHFNYTGGTKLMVLRTYQALNDAGFASIETSYLSSESQRLVDSRGAMPRTSPPNERYDWHLNIDQLARLHGFTRTFKFQPFNQGRIYSFGPGLERTLLTVPNDGADPGKWVAIAGAILSSVDVAKGNGSGASAKEVGRRIWTLLNPRRWEISREGDFPALPSVTQEAIGFGWTSSAEPHWNNLPGEMNGILAKSCWVQQNGRWVYTTQNIPPAQLEQLHHFMQNGWLEVAVFGAAKQALERIGSPNYNLYHSFQLARLRPLDSSDSRVFVRRTFELDVVAILGYQLVLISCTNNQDAIKEKGFEAIHRARQVGGDAARAIVVCPCSSTEATRVQDSLYEETGAQNRPLEVWGVNTLHKLPEHFLEYFGKRLQWSRQTTADA